MLLSTFIEKTPMQSSCAQGDNMSSWRVCVLAHIVKAQRRQLQEWTASVTWHVCQILLPMPARICRFLLPWLEIRSVQHLLAILC